MELVTVDGEPKIMYTPYIYAEVRSFSIGYIIKDHKGYRTILNNKGYEKEGDVLMRDPDRIEPFMQELGKIWRDNVPDWRFSQLIENVFGSMNYVPWMLEEPRMLEEFHNYFEENGSGRVLAKTKGPQTRKRGRRYERGTRK